LIIVGIKKLGQNLVFFVLIKIKFKVNLITVSRLQYLFRSIVARVQAITRGRSAAF